MYRVTEMQVMKRMLFYYVGRPITSGAKLRKRDANNMIYKSCEDALKGLSEDERVIIEDLVKEFADPGLLFRGERIKLGEYSALELMASVAPFMRSVR